MGMVIVQPVTGPTKRLLLREAAKTGQHPDRFLV